MRRFRQEDSGRGAWSARRPRPQYPTSRRVPNPASVGASETGSQRCACPLSAPVPTSGPTCGRSRFASPKCGSMSRVGRLKGSADRSQGPPRLAPDSGRSPTTRSLSTSISRSRSLTAAPGASRRASKLRPLWIACASLAPVWMPRPWHRADRADPQEAGPGRARLA